MPLRVAAWFLERSGQASLQSIWPAYHDIVSSRPEKIATLIHRFLAAEGDDPGRSMHVP
jgi:hypothetical protein